VQRRSPSFNIGSMAAVGVVIALAGAVTAAAALST
jgi:hypothetical protein